MAVRLSHRLSYLVKSGSLKPWEKPEQEPGPDPTELATIEQELDDEITLGFSSEESWQKRLAGKEQLCIPQERATPHQDLPSDVDSNNYQSLLSSSG